jgi:acyl dehydratase
MEQDQPTIAAGESFSYEFSFGQKNVEDFVSLSGDSNVIHHDLAAAINSPIGAIAVPGLLTALIFSRVLGTMFPGHGTVYRSQSLEFLLPVVVGKKYIARFRVLSVNAKRHSARVDTIIEDRATGEICLEGIAHVINRNRL